MIAVDAVDKVYATHRGQTIHALDKVTFEVAEGEFLAIVGPSGCGKTTLLKILAGLVRPSGGVIKFDGAPLVGPRRDVGMVFQTAALFPWNTVLDNSMLAARVQHLSELACLDRARELIKLVGLEGFEGRYPSELSGGMQQRCAIIRALVHDPAILLLDEPFGLLDALTRDQMNVLLQDVWLSRRKTVVLITHSVSEAVFLADRVLVMSGRPGQILADLHVEAERPRSLELTSSAHFGMLAAKIRDLLGVERGRVTPRAFVD
jgi:NitT/TauT family transport system ATP-binding protein